MKKRLIIIVEIFLIVVVPIFSIGFDLFENSAGYKKFFRFLEIQEFMDDELTTPILIPIDYY